MKAVLITGAAKRIGRAMALGFAHAGYDIALHYNRSQKEAQATGEAIEACGRKCVLLQQDLQDLENIPTLVVDAQKAFSYLGLLINNASTFQRVSFAETTPDILMGEFTRNFAQGFFLTQAFAKIIKKGAVINMLDTAIHTNRSTHVPYLLSKKLLHEFTLMAAKELAPDIRVNAVSPGFILPTEGANNRDPKQYAASLPSRRQPTTDEVARAALMLAENDSMFGQVLYIDGGERLCE